MNKWMNEWMAEWLNGWMNEWVNEWMNEWVNEWMNHQQQQQHRHYHHRRFLMPIHLPSPTPSSSSLVNGSSTCLRQVSTTWADKGADVTDRWFRWRGFRRWEALSRSPDWHRNSRSSRTRKRLRGARWTGARTRSHHRLSGPLRRWWPLLAQGPHLQPSSDLWPSLDPDARLQQWWSGGSEEDSGRRAGIRTQCPRVQRYEVWQW